MSFKFKNLNGFTLSFLLHIVILLILCLYGIINFKQKDSLSINVVFATPLHKNSPPKLSNNSGTIKDSTTNTEANSESYSNVINDQSLLLTKPPAYPKSAIAKNQQGEVIVRLLTFQDKQIQKIVIYKSSGYDALDNEVLNTAKHWQIKKEISQPTWLQVRVVFTLK
ncbi:MAG: energy transducer TonB [Alphaproteobacteria bacterium]|jgi:TonB family protein|nr:energy transducer TonB [Alphaproteobacteria bacterium]